MREKGIRSLFWLSMGFSLAVYLSLLLLPLTALLRFAAPALGLGLLMLGIKGRRIRILSLAALGLALGFAVSYSRLSVTLLPSERLSGETLEVQCRVTEAAVDYGDYRNVVVRLTGEETPSVRCRLTIYDKDVSLSPGDELCCTVRFSSARVRYGEESDSLTGKGIFLRGTVKGEPELTGRWKYALLYLPLKLKEELLSLCGEVFPTDASPFQMALLTGEKTELYEDESLYSALSRAGLMHVAAVSGMHVSFLVGFLTLILHNKRQLSLLCLPFLLLFAALTGFTPSVCRAVFMQAVLLLSPLVRREADSLTSLSLALALLLWWNPCSALSVSLQLSFGAAAGIILFGNSLFQRLRTLWPSRGILAAVGVTVSSALAASLAAQVFTLPLMALHFGSVSLVSPLSNVLCLWLISALFVGGFLALLLGAVSPMAGAGLGAILAWGDRFVFFVARRLAALPYAALYMENRLFFGWLLLSYVLFLGFALSAGLRKREMKLLRPLSISLLALSLCICAVRTERNRSGMTVTAIDVGQGACTLIERGNTAVMVDCGGVNSLTPAGERAVSALSARGRRELSALILTHLHRDHANGVETLFASIKVQRLYLPRLQETEAEPELLSIAERYGVPVVFVDSELTLEGDGLRLRLTPPPDYYEEEPGLFVLASYGEFDALITGDGDSFLERRYVQLNEPGKVELLMVGHHGSNTSTSEALLEALEPECAVISVGYNTYGHPTEKTLQRLQAYDIDIFRTDTDGTISFRGEEDGSFNEEGRSEKRQ